MKGVGLKIDRLWFAVRLKNVIFPIDLRESIDLLHKSGYSLTPQASQPLPPPPARISMVGAIATKADCVVNINSDMGVIGVDGKSAMVLTIFDELSSLIKDKLDVNVDESAMFYETMISVTIYSERNPMERLSKLFENIVQSLKFSEVLDEEVSGIAIRLASKGKVPNQEEWLDFLIEPDIIRPTKAYSCRIVYRSANKLKVRKFIQNLNNKVSGVIKLIEG